MRYIAIIKKSNLELCGFRAVENLDSMSSLIGEWANLEEYAHVVVPDGVEKETLSPELVSGEIVLQEKQEKGDSHRKNLMSFLRKQRDEKLAESDWTQLDDAPLNKQQKDAWKLYRKALRDITKNTVDPLNPTWPQMPT